MGGVKIEDMLRDGSPEPGLLPRGSSRIFWWLPVAIGALATIFYAQFWLPHDDSWYLIATRKLLEGQKLYVDIIEINPPLNFYLTAPALFLADAIGTSDTIAYVIQTCFLAVLSCLWMARILQNSTLDQTERWIFLAAGIIGVFLLPIREFAQREHLLLILALPYFYLALLDEEAVDLSAGEKCALGLVAMFGIALKPYFLLLPAAIVLVGPWRELFRRIFTPANMGLAAGLVVYALFVILIHPEYFSDILIVATKVYYAYGNTTLGVFVRIELVAAALTVALLNLRGGAIELIGWRIIAGSLAALLAYLLQLKGWNYHIIPFSFFIALSCAWVTYKKNIISQGYIFGGLIVLSITIFTIGNQLKSGPHRAHLPETFSRYVDQKEQQILVYSTNVFAAFPFINAVEGKWSSRYPAQWIIPGAFRRIETGECGRVGDCADYEHILMEARSANTQDFLRYRPELVFVDEREYKSYFGGLTFDYIDFMKADPVFADAWSGCRQIGAIAEPAYSVWRCV